MRGIHRALGCSTYLSVWREVGALCVELLAVFVPSLPTLCFPLCISVTGACSSRGRGGSWLGCQVLPAIGAVSILELAANSGSSRMFRAPNLQRATMLFTFNIVGDEVKGHNVSSTKCVPLLSFPCYLLISYLICTHVFLNLRGEIKTIYMLNSFKSIAAILEKGVASKEY